MDAFSIMCYYVCVVDNGVNSDCWLFMLCIFCRQVCDTTRTWSTSYSSPTLKSSTTRFIGPRTSLTSHLWRKANWAVRTGRISMCEAHQGRTCEAHRGVDLNKMWIDLWGSPRGIVCGAHQQRTSYVAIPKRRISISETPQWRTLSFEAHQGIDLNKMWRDLWGSPEGGSVEIYVCGVHHRRTITDKFGAPYGETLIINCFSVTFLLLGDSCLSLYSVRLTNENFDNLHGDFHMVRNIGENVRISMFY